MGHFFNTVKWSEAETVKRDNVVWLTVPLLVGFLDEEVPAHDERTAEGDMQGVLLGLAILVKNHSIPKLEARPVVAVASLRNGLDDGRFLKPLDLVPVDSLYA